MSRTTPSSPHFQPSPATQYRSIPPLSLPLFDDCEMEQPAPLSLPSFTPATLSSLAQRARSRRTHSLPYHTALLLPPSTARTASDSPTLLPTSTSLSSATVAPSFHPPTFAVSISLKGGLKRTSLTQPPSPTWHSFIAKSRSTAMYAADDAALTRSSISSSLSSLQLPLTAHSIDIPESPLPPAELDEANRSTAFVNIDVDEAGTVTAAAGLAIGSSPQQVRLRPAPVRRSPRAWLLLWLVTLPTFMLLVTCGLIVYHSLMLYASLYIGYLVFLPAAPVPLSYQVTVILFMFAVIGRSAFNLLLTFARVRFQRLWANQRRHRQPLAFRQLHLINCILSAAALLSLPPALITMFVDSERTWTDPLLLVPFALIAVEGVAWLCTALILALLRRDFTWKELSFHCPHVPVSATFNSTALQRRTVEQHRRIIDALPVHRFSLDQWREERQQCQQQAGKSVVIAEDDEDEQVCCAICLVDMADGDMMRVLKCTHCFHQRCIDQWLERKTCCPLCVRQIDRSVTRERDRQKRRYGQRTAGVAPLSAPQVELVGM